MKRYYNYLKYIIRHKLFVYKAGKVFGCSKGRLLVHDLSKLLPFEFKSYAWTFYDGDGKGGYHPSLDFDYAGLFHQHKNKHHWQYGLLKEDDGELKPLPMPHEYMLEMLADWAGAGKAITGKGEIKDWYMKNKDKIILHNETRKEVEKRIDDILILKGK